MPRSPIVFLGFNKTATVSIHQLFRSCGFRSLHWDEGRLARRMFDNAAAGRPVLAGYERFEVFSDLCSRADGRWLEGNQLFRQMAADYPEARFVYHHRPMTAWLRSRARHRHPFTGEPLLLFFQGLLGTDDPTVVLEHWRETRLQLEQDLDAFFGDSPRLLRLSIRDPAFVAQLSQFIRQPLDASLWRVWNRTPASAAGATLVADLSLTDLPVRD